MAKQIGRVTYERRYVLITVPDEWQPGDPLPPANPTDQWVSYREFQHFTGGRYDRQPINRQPPRAERSKRQPPEMSGI